MNTLQPSQAKVPVPLGRDGLSKLVPPTPARAARSRTRLTRAPRPTALPSLSIVATDGLWRVLDPRVGAGGVARGARGDELAVLQGPLCVEVVLDGGEGVVGAYELEFKVGVMSVVKRLRRVEKEYTRLECSSFVPRQRSGGLRGRMSCRCRA